MDGAMESSRNLIKLAAIAIEIRERTHFMV